MKFTGPALKTKLIATGVHLGMSLVVFAFLAYQIYFHWYPEPYYSIDGGWQGMRLVAGVDLVLGPFLTFLIFDLAKRRREIILDLAIILVIQIAALTYGVTATYTNRPVAIVLIDEFLVSAVEEHYQESLDSFDVLTDYSDEKPPIIYAELPQELEALKEAKKKHIREGIPEHAQIELYQPREAFGPALRERQARSLELVEKTGSRELFERWLKQNQTSPDTVQIGWFQGRYGRVWLVFDGDGKYLSYF